jgi:serine O-acetyltransferase
MIKSLNDYKYFLEADRIALQIKQPNNLQSWLRYYRWNEIWKFQRLLRKTEYCLNCKTLLSKIHYFYLCNKLHTQQLKLGVLIEPNCFGPGLSIAHTGSIVVNGNARIGANCRIHVGVSIATKAGFSDRVPKIGNNVYIGPGAKIFGDITIADGIAIGANSVVNKTFTEPNVTIAGSPARIISDKGSDGLLIDAVKILNSKRID